ncbi:MAG: hypothetical protein ACYC3S_10085 [Chloroflexota bacterium]
MIEFLQANWSLLIFAALMLLMIRMHAGGHGEAHGGGYDGGHAHDANPRSAVPNSLESGSENDESATPTGVGTTRPRTEHHSSGCH